MKKIVYITGGCIALLALVFTCAKISSARNRQWSESDIQQVVDFVAKYQRTQLSKDSDHSFRYVVKNGWIEIHATAVSNDEARRIIDELWSLQPKIKIDICVIVNDGVGIVDSNRGVIYFKD